LRGSRVQTVYRTPVYFRKEKHSIVPLVLLENVGDLDIGDAEGSFYRTKASCTSPSLRKR
jgi:hypothetical protein